jgi:hypothetical protein
VDSKEPPSSPKKRKGPSKKFKSTKERAYSELKWGALIKISDNQCHHILIQGRSHPGNIAGSQVTPVLCHYKQDVYALLQCTCTWKTRGSTLGTEKENSREQKKKIVKKSTALPYHYHKDISINLESTLCWSSETSMRHRHVSGSSYTARKEQRRNSEFEPPQDEEFSKQLQLLLGFYSLAWHVSEQFCGKWSCHCFLDTNSYCTFSW